MEDRFVRGIVGGPFALDRLPRGLAGHSYAFIPQLLFSMFLGVVFVYLAPRIASRHYLIKGAFYGGIVWFFIKTAVLLYHLELLYFKNLSSAVENLADSVRYGILLAWIVRRFERRRQQEQGRPGRVERLGQTFGTAVQPMVDEGDQPAVADRHRQGAQRGNRVFGH
ncbi:hypothetical protein EDC14_1001167 [Hydrogenispora ethanolica]|uniref:Uncharacterized protein n=1 Tax=Hydrogenispora ethanolica TaxID=1082276 RepID=A0A4R1SDZ1_HYDET|nr:hypothetical protein [Hydrogenispora ethanolica]TCL76882.1 hypothetical protein EDC14_1001167 [Hydrogenispora ethanolica]